MAVYSFKITRFDPSDSDKKSPHEVSYSLDIDDKTTLLDALIRLREEQDPTLSFRWSCRTGICGSDGVIANGKSVLACSVYCKDVARKIRGKFEIRVEPMRNMPVLKDLITDIDGPISKMRSVKSHVDVECSGNGECSRPINFSKKEQARLKKTSQCIKCMLCYSVCPVYGQDKDFVGPGAGALAYRYQVDPRDKNGKARLDKLAGEKDGVFGCSFVGECSAVCPKRVDPAQALQRLKLKGAIRVIGKRLTD